MLKKKNIVYPGDFIAVSEEYSQGKNVFERDGKIYSSKVGEIVLDEEKRVASVKSREPEVMSVGTEVIAQVRLLKPQSVYMIILDATKNGKPVKVHNQDGLLFIRDVSEEYVKELEDCFNLGDLVKARIVKIDKEEATLTTKDPELGVVKAFCTKCRAPLKLEGKFLKCYNCNSVEKRKTSKLYDRLGEQ